MDALSTSRFRASAPALATFSLLTVVFYWFGYWLIFRLERASPLMMSVGLAAVLTCLLHGRSLSSLGLLWGSRRYQWLSFLIPIGISVFSYLLIWGLGLAEFDLGFADSARETYNLVGWSDASIIAFHVLLTTTFSLLISVPSILGEELAWRGFLVPELSKFMSFGNVALTSGFLWSVFHWPLMLKGFYGSEHTPLLMQLGLFTLFIVSNSITMTYLRYKTDSVWSAVLFHACINIYIQKILTPLTVSNSTSAWFIDEFGLVVPLVAFLVAIYFWMRAVREFS